MSKNLSLRFSEWLSSPAGQLIAEEEIQMLACILKENKQLENVLIVGETSYHELIRYLPEGACTLVGENVTQNDLPHVVKARYTALPFLLNSMDLIILPHTLDFSLKPHKILQEVNHCLKPEGVLVIVGFNPWGFFGLRRFFSLRQLAPWCGNFRPALKVLDWLSVLSFKRVSCHYGVFHFPIFTHSLQFLRHAGKTFCHLFPFSSGVYVIVSKKRVLGMTPYRKRWKRTKNTVENGVPNPAVREISQ